MRSQGEQKIFSPPIKTIRVRVHRTHTDLHPRQLAQAFNLSKRMVGYGLMPMQHNNSMYGMDNIALLILL